LPSFLNAVGDGDDSGIGIGRDDIADQVIVLRRARWEQAHKEVADRLGEILHQIAGRVFAKHVESRPAVEFEDQVLVNLGGA